MPRVQPDAALHGDLYLVRRAPLPMPRGYDCLRVRLADSGAPDFDTSVILGWAPSYEVAKRMVPLTAQRLGFHLGDRQKVQLVSDRGLGVFVSAWLDICDCEAGQLARKRLGT